MFFSRVRSATWICMCGHIPTTWLYIPSFIEIRSGVSEPQGVKIGPFSLLSLLAFTTARTTVQTVTTPRTGIRWSLTLFAQIVYFIDKCKKPVVFSKRQRITLRLLYAMSRPSVCLSVVCLLSVTLVHPTQAVELFGYFFSPYDSSETLLFWCQKSLVGDAPFPLKFAFKVTHPP